MAGGLHHVTMITRRAQANLDFYAGFLGLRLVKRSAGFEDARQLHLFYGDGSGRPGSLVTFLAWEDGSPGRPGLGQAVEISLAVGAESLGFWLTRCLTFGVKHELPSRLFGQAVLRLSDPDGIALNLVADSDARSEALWQVEGLPAEHAVRRLHGATILSDRREETASFLERHLGYRRLGEETGRLRLSSGADVLDIRDGSGFWPGAPGSGTIDHLAFRAPDLAALTRSQAALAAEGVEVTPPKDRRYFSSIYLRESSGVLLELATEGPGMTLDEPAESLGRRLFVPEGEDARDIEVMLPQIALPGSARERHPDLLFVHRLYRPEAPDGSVLVLLHGSGGNETDLLPLAHRAAPRATLLGLRGRASEEGSLRWFRRPVAGHFDQADIAAEAEAFAAFLPEVLAAYDLDPLRTSFLGYSNGANFLATTLLLQPGLLRRAALLRPIPVLETPPGPDLSYIEILSLSGREDDNASRGAELEACLMAHGARVEARSVDAGHDLVAEDESLLRAWL